MRPTNERVEEIRLRTAVADIDAGDCRDLLAALDAERVESYLNRCAYDVQRERAEAAEARVRALEEGLRAATPDNPWERCSPGDGLCTTDEPFQCFACGAEVRYADVPVSEPLPRPDQGVHYESCSWFRARALLPSPPEVPADGRAS